MERGQKIWCLFPWILSVKWRMKWSRSHILQGNCEGHQNSTSVLPLIFPTCTLDRRLVVRWWICLTTVSTDAVSRFLGILTNSRCSWFMFLVLCPKGIKVILKEYHGLYCLVSISKKTMQSTDVILCTGPDTTTWHYMLPYNHVIHSLFAL